MSKSKILLATLSGVFLASNLEHFFLSSSNMIGNRVITNFSPLHTRHLLKMNIKETLEPDSCLAFRFGSFSKLTKELMEEGG